MTPTNAILIDTEATSNDPVTSKVIELAELMLPATPLEFISSGVQSNAKGILFGTDEPIAYGAMATHHLIPSDISGLPPFGEYVIPPDVAYVVGHNVDFDADILKIDETNGPVARICTLAIARRLWGHVDSRTQSALIYYIGEKFFSLEWARERLKNAHRAADDVNNCAYVLYFLLIEAQHQGWAVDTWDNVYQLSQECRIPTTMGFGKHKGDDIKTIPSSYAAWYARQDDADPYYLQAFRRAGLIR